MAPASTRIPTMIKMITVKTLIALNQNSPSPKACTERTLMETMKSRKIKAHTQPGRVSDETQNWRIRAAAAISTATVMAQFKK
jgi:hypothetical protein